MMIRVMVPYQIAEFVMPNLGFGRSSDAQARAEHGYAKRFWDHLSRLVATILVTLLTVVLLLSVSLLAPPAVVRAQGVVYLPLSAIWRAAGATAWDAPPSLWGQLLRAQAIVQNAGIDYQVCLHGIEWMVSLFVGVVVAPYYLHRFAPSGGYRLTIMRFLVWIVMPLALFFAVINDSVQIDSLHPRYIDKYDDCAFSSETCFHDAGQDGR
jgi:hypothetical protein